VKGREPQKCESVFPAVGGVFKTAPVLICKPGGTNVSLDHYYFFLSCANRSAGLLWRHLGPSSLRFGDSDQSARSSRIAAGRFGSASILFLKDFAF
jgi:hypothetical protein